jgi:ATP-binding cassette subfamily E protein 1
MGFFGKQRIAVIEKSKCINGKGCNFLCASVCPVNRTGKDCITLNEKNKPVISEELCTGCNICVKKCPTHCITIVNLAVELKTMPLHSYGQNSFRIYGMPLPKSKAFVGLFEKNGLGKTTVLKILSKKLIPNLGNLEEPPSIEKVIKFFKGNELMNFFKKLKDENIKVSLKPQNVDEIPKHFNGRIKELLRKVDEKNLLEELSKKLEIDSILSRKINEVSGGELQRIAICAAMLKEADFYFFDEPSSYLDVKQRLKVAALISNLGKEKSVMVVEHDLAVLDSLSDFVHIFFGVPNVFGRVSNIKSVKNGVNEFLTGFLKEENIRFREKELKFEAKADIKSLKKNPLIEYPLIEKKLENFYLKAFPGTLFEGEIIGILGPNAIGKTTLVKIFANILKPDNCSLNFKLRVSYKPQYLEAKNDLTVQELFQSNELNKELFNSEINKRLDINALKDSKLNTLSGGELQKVSIAFTLSRKADLFLLDEPSAFIDFEDRLKVASTIRAVTEKTGKTALIVDHDLMFIDFISDRLIVFQGVPGKNGVAKSPMSLHEGMNLFLKELNISFRRDKKTGMVRANKLDSVLDREQKSAGQYYYFKA